MQTVSILRSVVQQAKAPSQGTYPLPEAQLDRFLLDVRIGYPDASAEHAILKLARHRAQQALGTPLTPARQLTKEQIFAARKEVLAMHMGESVETYIVHLVLASRDPSRYSESLARRVNFGASPRATIALDRCARAHAWLQGKDYVSPDDVQAVSHEALRHRILISFEAEAEGITSDSIIGELLRLVPVA